MSILTQYREKLHLKDAERGINQKRKNTSGTFTGLSKVGIILNMTEDQAIEAALKFKKQLQKEAGTIEILGYVDVKGLKEELPFACFCKKDLDWLWRPKNEVVATFKQQHFDLLINLCQTDCFPLEYLAVAISANYKIGALTNYPNNYDLMLDSKNLKSYLEQVHFFLEKFSK